MNFSDSQKLLVEDVLAGRISRRALLKRAAVLGVSAPVIASLLAACEDDDDGVDDDVDDPATEPDEDEPEDVDEDVEDEEPDEEDDPDDEPVDEPDEEEDDDEAAEAPSEAGGGGRLDLLWWQAVDIINPHLAQGTKDFDASNVVYEALAYTDDDGSLIPRLAAEIPSIEDGSVDEDGMFVTWTLRDDVYWHDGEQFTAEDVRFTWEFTSNEETTSTTIATYEAIEDIEIEDDFTVTLRFREPTPGWYVPFTGGNGLILPEHLFRDYVGTESRNAPYNLEPIGTGPFRVAEFRPADTVFFERNEEYWDSGKPYFDTVEMIGGGDATSAARAVIVTGEGDWAWNIQVEADILDALEEQGDAGFVLASDGTSAERIMVNFADPWEEVDGARAEPSTEHPFLRDQLVRDAIKLSIQRDVIADQLYGAGGVATANNLNAPEWAVNPDLTWEFDLDQAAALLDEAGAEDTDGDGVREYEGTPMYMLYQTSINSIRQSNQEIVKDDLDSIGFDVELKAVDAAVFFSSDAGNPDTYGHFYADIQMYTNGPTTPYPVNWVQRFASWEIAEQANAWSGTNITRYASDEMDEIIEAIATEMDPDEQERLFQEMNRIAAEDGAEIPIVFRTNVATVGNDLAGYHFGPWRSDLWDIGNWYREE
jgi:peptide/nickel transport system substrate-binding protein